MTWEILGAIIARHGIEFAVRLIQMELAGGKPTLEQLAELRAIAAKSGADYEREARERVNVVHE